PRRRAARPGGARPRPSRSWAPPLRYSRRRSRRPARRPARPVAPLRETARDLGRVALRVRSRFDLCHEAGAVARLDRVALGGGPRELDVLEVLPAGALDRDGEALHVPIIAARAPRVRPSGSAGGLERAQDDGQVVANALQRLRLDALGRLVLEEGQRVLDR